MLKKAIVHFIIPFLISLFVVLLVRYFYPSAGFVLIIMICGFMGFMYAMLLNEFYPKI